MKTGKKQTFWLFTGLIAVISLLLYGRAPFLYTVNDDLFMKNIVSGAYLGVPDAHTVYMEYPLSFFLSALYRMAAGVPWYGIVFFLFHTVSWGAICSRCFNVLKKETGAGGNNIVSQLTAAFFMLLLFVPAGFYHIASMQFTVTAAMLGAAALVWFLTADSTLDRSAFLKDQLVTALFVFLSFNVRRNVLLMFVPVAGMLWLGRLLLEDKQGLMTAQKEPVEKKKRVICFTFMALLCAAGIFVSYVSYHIAYRSEGWKNYIRYNDNATVLYDYSGWPDYETNEDLYEELGITYESWYGAKTAYLLSVDNRIDATAMERLAERSRMLHTVERTLPQTFWEAIKICVQRMYTETDRPLNLLVAALYAAVLCGLLCGRKYRTLLQLGLFFAGRMFSWLYVVAAGRYPVRITQSLLLMECAVLLVFFLKDAVPGYGTLWRQKPLPGIPGNKKVNKLCKLVILAGTAGFMFLIGYFGVARIRHVSQENTRRLEESRDLEEVAAYCSAHPEQFYLVDTRSVTNDTERIFDGAKSKYENYIVFGGWLSESPVYLQKLRTEGAENVEEALLTGERVFVIAKQEESCPTDYITLYFESRYKGFQMEEIERFGRRGGQFAVYRLGADTEGGMGG